MKDWRIHHPIAVVDGTNRFFQSQSWTQVKPNVGVCRGDGSGLRTRSVVDDIVKTKIGGSQSLKVLLKERPCRHQCSVCVPEKKIYTPWNNHGSVDGMVPIWDDRLPLQTGGAIQFHYTQNILSSQHTSGFLGTAIYIILILILPQYVWPTDGDLNKNTKRTRSTWTPQIMTTKSSS